MQPAQGRGDGWTPGRVAVLPAARDCGAQSPPGALRCRRQTSYPRRPARAVEGRTPGAARSCRDSARVPPAPSVRRARHRVRAWHLPLGRTPKWTVRSPQTMRTARALLKPHTQTAPRATPKGERRGGARDCGWPVSPSLAGRSKPWPPTGDVGHGPDPPEGRPGAATCPPVPSTTLCLALASRCGRGLEGTLCCERPRVCKEDKGTIGPSSARVERTLGVPRGWRRGRGGCRPVSLQGRGESSWRGGPVVARRPGAGGSEGANVRSPWEVTQPLLRVRQPLSGSCRRQALVP